MALCKREPRARSECDCACTRLRASDGLENVQNAGDGDRTYKIANPDRDTTTRVHQKQAVVCGAPEQACQRRSRRRCWTPTTDHQSSSVAELHEPTRGIRDTWPRRGRCHGLRTGRPRSSSQTAMSALKARKSARCEEGRDARLDKAMRHPAAPTDPTSLSQSPDAFRCDPHRAIHTELRPRYRPT